MRLLILLLTFLCIPFAFAQKKPAIKTMPTVEVRGKILCHNGSPENMQLDQFLKSIPYKENPTTLAESYIHDNHKLARLASSVVSASITCLRPDGLQEGLNSLAEVLNSIGMAKLENRCIQAALRREIRGANFLCEGERSTRRSVASSTLNGFCITDRVVDYITYATNLALDCFSPEDRPLDPLVLFLKLNNESGFNFSLNGSIGQNTPISLLDMNRETDIFENTFANKRTSCKVFEKAVKAPEERFSKECQLNHPDMGLARALAYSLGYFLRVRDEINKEFKNLAKNLKIEDIRFENLAALVMYSRHAEESDTVEKLKELLGRHKNSYTQFATAVEEKFAYLREMKKTAREVLDLATPKIEKIEQCVQD